LTERGAALSIVGIPRWLAWQSTQLLVLTLGPCLEGGGGTGGLTVPKKTISKQESHSSIRTVVAVSENATPTREVPDPYSSYSQGGSGPKLSETPRKVSNGESKNGTNGRPFGHQKQLSEAAMSELLLDDHDDSKSQSQSQRGGAGSGKHIPRQSEKVMTRRREDIEEAERRFRDSGWDVVKESLEIYAEEVCCRGILYFTRVDLWCRERYRCARC
jgi:hypothetical protein